jgi:hypothetical protein
VPLVFYGPTIAPGRHAEFETVASLGPTLARLIGASPGEPVDGHVLTAAIR